MAAVFLVPKDNKAEKIILVNPPLWQGRHLLKSLLINLKTEKTPTKDMFYWLWRFIIMPRQNFLMGQKRKLEFLPTGPNVNIVRNINDPYFSPQIAVNLKNNGQKVIILPGAHNQLWLTPTPITKLL